LENNSGIDLSLCNTYGE